MNRLKSTLLLLALVFVTQSEAQIWKKLGKKVEKAAERTIEKKVEEKTERETEKAFDSTFNNKRDKKGKGSNSKTSKATPANTYSFTHKYVMLIDDGKRKTTINYYINKQGDYFGTSIPSEKGDDVISVMDITKKTMFMYMDNRGDKTLMSMRLNFNQFADDAIEESNVQVSATGNTKTILGYSCSEYKVEGDNTSGSVWVTQQAGVTFSKAFYQAKAKKGIDQNWMSLLQGLPLEMDMTDKSKRKPKPIKMTCIALEQEVLVLKSSHYKKLM